MARIFLDANQVIDVLARRTQHMADALEGHDVYTSTLNIHIFCYVFNRKIPNPTLTKIIQEDFHLVPFTEKIAHMSLKGPTKDFEDNVQLHSATKAECDLFLTNDKKLLKMGYFGKTKLVSNLEDS